MMASCLPLSGIVVVEFGGLAPGPFCGLLLADFGATVIKINKINGGDGYDVLNRNNKITINIDIKSPLGGQVIRQLLKSADVLIDPFRPGVMEKIGFGPKEVFDNINPRIIYARLTGYGQPKDSPSWQYAGHDINYLAATGVLDILPHRLPPISILGSFAGGGLLCAFGILLALRRRDITNRGEVIDCNMVQGVTYLSSFIFAMMSKDTPFLNDRKGCGGILRYESHFYNVYETLDGRHLAVGAIERKFYQRFLKGMGVEDDEDFIVGHVDSSRWPRLIERSKNIIKQKRLDEWMGIFDLRESCVSPILTIAEAKNNSNLFVNGQALPKPAPQLDGVVGTTKGGEISSRTAKILDYLNKDEVVKEATKAGVVIMPKVKSNL
ncbi:hypothetical protein FOZ63_012996 [Perkinsus olseni]|uniref:Alpha-methylacyl-CoA racemase n=1 Tax=Perkinsus olseni TaxID=32597 RepID=A0A7J6UMF8_PEROL|nr:hypothetical protein FOZ63_012996 [Perkinsus olseni]